MIRCGNCKSRHATVTDIRDCYAEAADYAAEYDAEMAYERHLEDRGYDEARLQDQYEANHGVISFSDAWDMACPERITERAKAQRIEAINLLRRPQSVKRH